MWCAAGASLPRRTIALISDFWLTFAFFLTFFFLDLGRRRIRGKKLNPHPRYFVAREKSSPDAWAHSHRSRKKKKKGVMRESNSRPSCTRRKNHTTRPITLTEKKTGVMRESNSRPLAPKARIIPLETFLPRGDTRYFGTRHVCILPKPSQPLPRNRLG